MPRRTWLRSWNGPGTAFTVRLGFAVAALALGVQQHRAIVVAPWVAAILAVDLLHVTFERLNPVAAERWRLLTVTLFIASATVAVQAVGTAVVPLALIPALYAGLALGLRGTLLVGWVTPVVAIAMSEATNHHELHGVRILLLIVPMMVAALIASHWHRPPPNKRQVAVGEAKDLIIRLSSLADSLDTGFDLPALGDAALEEIAQTVQLERAAVLLRLADDAIPVSLHGHTRMPWAPPTAPESVLGQTWRQGAAVRRAFLDGQVRRHLLCVPIIGADDGVVGMFAMDRESEPFSVTDQHHVESIARRVASLVEVGVLFSRLRGRAALEERSRLARDMHDGVAQDLAALSFSVDILIQQAPESDPLRSGLESLRSSMRSSLSDIRHQISTLRMTERPDVSFGSILSAALQGFGTQTGVRTTLTLDESPFRLPAHLEMQVHRILLDLLADARTSRATFVDWDIRLAAPNARLVLMHDGTTPLAQEMFADHPLHEHAKIVVESLIPTGLFVDITIGDDPRPLGRRTLSSPPPRSVARETSRVNDPGSAGEVHRGSETSTTPGGVPTDAGPTDAARAFSKVGPTSDGGNIRVGGSDPVQWRERPPDQVSSAGPESSGA